jgi:hypothetical protein
VGALDRGLPDRYKGGGAALSPAAGSTMTRLTKLSLLAILVAAAGIGCRTLYYDTMEQFGWEKRHLLVDRIEDTREEQGEAQEQFQTAFDRFKAITEYDGGDLEKLYRRLADEQVRSERKADRVRTRIQSVEEVAGDLFKEWESEIDEISSADLRRQSSDKLRETRSRYGTMLSAMKRAEAKMDPVLTAFRDQVLFLKHNLNADAISSLEGTVSSIEEEVQELIDELSAAIREADTFLGSIES